ncbi:family 78 glycoside hydrolase catalytic domain [Bacillus swezeyi]|uniref:Sugar hydrolase n=1 Tax=Bacillus swezeyi TaxID=1925020 RepID=A0A1R1QZM5_9BACI|nr:family 78 glycoside hydrolase catalytic domain [Bacillus swezeyi]MEC1259778.1 family 78 glycoside hydrolase catalytic domain [Bacillus swezeyi]MED2930110.1 family 78 glycoside hydrolase catalytic domain [Bacillus swezeyi]MED2944827.1 family 78 glycoside hydrolase catalytic domain [Bacillus swezeyi]MED2963001.1 family 78 glycoside hydrolase catalytic domain [Bacillus swezeyi]MED2976294.1 family 78 glycoside hydrolase catalytic domain [Bacillus swezeyi]
MKNKPKIQTNKRAIKRNEYFINTAEQLKPQLLQTTVRPDNLAVVSADRLAIHGWRAMAVSPAEELGGGDYGKGDQFILDFGTHLVGYVSMYIKPIGSPPDAPLRLRLTFGEMPVEMAEPFSEYNGWISSSWLQEETIYIDMMPGQVELPRRYSFRYLKFDILDTSPKYRVAFDEVTCRTVTSADSSRVKPLIHEDQMMCEIDKVSMKTLQNCMQDVFEDGPKRDRRLWLGDLRLQALSDYETFQNYDLVKRCLYLFAGLPDAKGQVAANLFTAPEYIADDTYFFDYSLLFVSTLYDYYFAANDRGTLSDLWPTAYRQIELALDRLDERDIVQDDDSWYSFIDWHEKLNKQASSQAILIYAMKQAVKLAEVLESGKRQCLNKRLQEISSAAIAHLWDKEKGFFVSGQEKQISWASQIWMGLAEVLPPAENRRLMQRLLSEKPAIGLTTPYMHHYLVEALILVGEKEKAISHIKGYWGEMMKDGADAFWEAYDPNDKAFSPYGSQLINSYCHAWSCTPAYFIRKYRL